MIILLDQESHYLRWVAGAAVGSGVCLLHASQFISVHAFLAAVNC
jgi:hypothetical protein